MLAFSDRDDLFVRTQHRSSRDARAKKGKGKGRRRSSGKKGRSRGRSKGLPGWLKNLFRVAVGGTVGALATPFLPEAASGIGLGIATAGLVSGRGAWSLIAVGAGVQAVKTISRTETFGKAAVAMRDAAQKALPSGSSSGLTADDLVDAAAGG